MDTLLDGHRRFRETIWPDERARYEALATWGQKPPTLVVSCSDSRVDPQTVFGAVPGEMFVIRNVAAIVPPFRPDGGCHGTSAALEFGVKVLGVSRIVVLGHAQCGGVRAMVEGAPPEVSDFVEPWIAVATPVLHGIPPELAGPARLDRCELEVVRLSLANLLTFPWIAERVADGRLALAGFRFDIHTGILVELHEHGVTPVAV